MKVLITGFQPFGGESINPAYEAVKLLPQQIDGASIVKREIPVVFNEGAEVVRKAIQKENPDIVICVGQAGGRSGITLEFVGINYADARIPDNNGGQPVDQTIQPDGENAYFTSLPVKAMVSSLKQAGIPASISYSAGTYVCNDVMYQLLYFLHTEFAGRMPAMRGGFIHVPFADEQVVNKPNTPSLPLGTIARGLELCIRAAIQNETDVHSIGGTIQ